MGMLGKKFAGLDDLCTYYQELGMNASILPDNSPEAIQEGFIKQDNGYIKVTGKNFHLFTVRMKGTTSGSYNLGNVGGVNLGSKEKIPFEYHHIVKKEISDENGLKANLKKKTKGLLSKEITAVTWEGGRLASALNADSELNASIMKFITSQDDMKVEPDKKKKIIRIVFSRPSETKSGLLHGGFKFDRNLLPKDAIDVIDRIAALA